MLLLVKVEGFMSVLKVTVMFVALLTLSAFCAGETLETWALSKVIQADNNAAV